jgi:hypothetical protein
MQPSLWQPPIDPSPTEQAIMKRIKRAKLFMCLRKHRHELFTEAFQQELAALYQPSKRGQPPIPPALLALATLLQAYTGASDDEVIEAIPWIVGGNWCSIVRTRKSSLSVKGC